MTCVSQSWVWLVAGMMAWMAQAGAAAPAAVVFAPVAHSAQLTLETASTPTGLTLRLRRTQGTTPLGVTDLTVAIDGHDAQLTPRGDDTWSAAWPAGSGARGGKLEAVLTHDGIREVLSGTLPGAPAATAVSGAADGGRSGGGMLRDHKQLAWWILNITVVLIAALAISRRTS
jgi:hypothetical protein